MLKRVLFLMTLVVFMTTGSAIAAPMTWTDEIDFVPDQYISAQQDPFTFTHDIKDDGFVPGTDEVFDYSLNIGLRDDRNGADEFNLFWGVLGEVAYIDQPGWIADGILYNFSYVNMTYGWSFAGRYALNSTGEMDVTVTSWWGDFYLDYSTLTANGEGLTANAVAPVPEPSTLILLGAGISGLALYRRKKN